MPTVFRCTILVFLISWLAVPGSLLLADDHGSWATPAHSFEAAFTYPGQVLGQEEQANLDITLRNTGLSGDTFNVEVTEAPLDWDIEISRFNTILSGIFLAGEETTTLTLLATPPNEAEILPLGTYAFAIKITSVDGKESKETRSVITVSDHRKNKEALSLTTSYPEIGGPSDGRFAFSLDIKNNAAEDALVNLVVDAPQNWEYSFKPGYEDKQISSIQVPKGQSRSVTLDLTPAYLSETGAYPLRVMVESTLGSAETNLVVNLSGTYKIRAVPANDLLSTSTEVGQPVTVSLFVINDGSAPQKEISFMTVKPDNWTVEFKPENIVGLEPRGNPVQVDMTIIPAPNALVGDYGLGVNIQGEKTQNALDFRVSVKAGSAWAWVGGVLIIVVVLALALTFRRLGRR